jgi:predicted RNA binding protein YcfA (HicA-like mRNA interferase family)
MPKKIREIKAILNKAGFIQLKKRGKGSHQIWEHSKLPDPIVISRKDGDDAPLYLEKQIENALKRLQEMEE